MPPSPRNSRRHPRRMAGADNRARASCTNTLTSTSPRWNSSRTRPHAAIDPVSGASQRFCLFCLQGGQSVTTLARSVKTASSLRSRLDAVRERIARAAERSGRRESDVTLVAVIKTVPEAVVREALALGLSDLGESRVQEAEAHVAALGRSSARWHLIGHLQRNKAGRAAALFDRVHSVDGAEIAN